jgi:hypothetical protein
MSDDLEEIRRRRGRYQPNVLIFLAVAAVLAGWSVYLLKAYHGINIVGRPTPTRGPDRSLPTGVELVLALIATFIAAPLCLIKARKIRALAAHGAQAAGLIVRIGSVAKGGIGPVTVAYQVDGVDYETKEDYALNLVDLDQAVTVIYDPAKPSRCMVIWKST